jgi:hypothetical protein
MQSTNWCPTDSRQLINTCYTQSSRKRSRKPLYTSFFCLASFQVTTFGQDDGVSYDLHRVQIYERSWLTTLSAEAWLNIDQIGEIDKSEEARASGWEDLVIPEKHSQLLVSLVDNHASAIELRKNRNESGHSIPTAQIDLVKGKGRGLIILLHGPPGSGKTSTAETIAAYTGRPLYAITCGDIGTTVVEVEENLQGHAERAEKWGCVLLLDEADVFLMRRSWNDMHRNALVSGNYINWQ